MSKHELPWNEPALREWAICGMNHYHQQGVRRLFVSMTRQNVCITAEGPFEEDVFRDLTIQAAALNLIIQTGADAEAKVAELEAEISRLHRVIACAPEGAPPPVVRPYTGPTAEQLEAMPSMFDRREPPVPVELVGGDRG